MYYVIIGYADHGYNGNGTPVFCSQTFDSKKSAEDNVEHLPVKNRGYDILYQILEVDGEFLDQW